MVHNKLAVTMILLSNVMHKYQVMKWASPCKNESSGICGQRRPRSAGASAQSDQGYAQADHGFHYRLTEPFDTIEGYNGE